MAHFLRKINNYLKVKLFDKMDKKAWKFDERDYDNCLLYEKSDKALIRKFYPDDDPEDKHLLEQFIAYIYKFEMKMVVEPLYGWVIPGKLKVFKRSFPYVFDIWDNKKRMPSIIHFLLPKKVVEIDSCISIRYYWQNYYHFFIDTLSQVYLAKDKIPADVPILVPYYFGDIKYVNEFLKESDFLADRKIIVQKKNEYYSVKKLYLCKDTFYSDSIYEVINSFGAITDKEDKPGRKIYLKRSKSRNRAIINDGEIEQIVTAFGFEVKDTDGMGLKEQILLFREVSVLIGIHGAGLTNIIFRNGQPLQLLEIFPADLNPGHYRSLCMKFNYSYDFIRGGSMDNDRKKSFHLDPDLLKGKLNALTC